MLFVRYVNDQVTSMELRSNQQGSNNAYWCNVSCIIDDTGELISSQHLRSEAGFVSSTDKLVFSHPLP